MTQTEPIKRKNKQEKNVLNHVQSLWQMKYV